MPQYGFMNGSLFHSFIRRAETDRSGPRSRMLPPWMETRRPAICRPAHASMVLYRKRLLTVSGIARVAAVVVLVEGIRQRGVDESAYVAAGLTIGRPWVGRQIGSGARKLTVGGAK